MIKINLAPPTGRKRPAGFAAPDLDLGLVFGVLLLVLVGTTAAYWWKVSSDVAWLTAEIERNQQERTRLQAVIEEGQRFKREKEDLERRVNAIETVARNQARPAYLIDAVAEMLPPNLWLTRIEEKGQQLRLAGTTYSSVTLSDFMANLKTSGKFKEVDLLESRQDLTKSPRMITFEVTCRFEI